MFISIDKEETPFGYGGFLLFEQAQNWVLLILKDNRSQLQGAVPESVISHLNSI